MIKQVALFFLVGTILIGSLTCVAVMISSYESSKHHMEDRLLTAAQELEAEIKAYPAHQWLLTYWYENIDELDPVYETDQKSTEELMEKCRLLNERHPSLMPSYATEEELEALPPEDQKLYAENVYSWIVARMDKIAHISSIEYLFCFVTDAPYDDQCIILSEASEDINHGASDDPPYMIGKTLESTDPQKEAIGAAVHNEPDYAVETEGDYVDYYYSIGKVDGNDVLIGVTHETMLFKETVRAQAQRMGVVFLLLLIIMSSVCLLIILFSILRPLKKVQETIRLYKKTKDSEEVRQQLSEIKSRNEIGVLSDDVADMTKEIDDYLAQIERITSERQRIIAELNLARNIQASMLPRNFEDFPKEKGFELYASMEPAREVGGDFYDFFLVDDDHLYMVMADVSGKGIPAALFMMASQITLQNIVKGGSSPAEVLTYANESIARRNPQEMFVTVWVGILDLNTGKLTASNGGHETPILMHPGGDFEFFKDKHGFVLGGMEGMKYWEYEIQMEPGAKLFLYTDGLPEAHNDRSKMFGPDRILEALNENKEASPEEIENTVKKAVNEFVGNVEQFDDLTMMCVEYLGKTGREE